MHIDTLTGQFSRVLVIHQLLREALGMQKEHMRPFPALIPGSLERQVMIMPWRTRRSEGWSTKGATLGKGVREDLSLEVTLEETQI